MPLTSVLVDHSLVCIFMTFPGCTKCMIALVSYRANRVIAIFLNFLMSLIQKPTPISNLSVASCLPSSTFFSPDVEVVSCYYSTEVELMLAQGWYHVIFQIFINSVFHYLQHCNCRLTKWRCFFIFGRNKLKGIKYGFAS